MISMIIKAVKIAIPCLVVDFFIWLYYCGKAGIFFNISQKVLSTDALYPIVTQCGHYMGLVDVFVIVVLFIWFKIVD